MLNVDRESLAIAMQLREKIPYGARKISKIIKISISLIFATKKVRI
jgi:hypothetical protein